MSACIKSLSLVYISNIIRSIASLVVVAGVSVKDKEFSFENDFLHIVHSYAMEATQRDYLYAGTHSSCAQLACFKRVHPSQS
jgi:hypothetical protein